MAARSFDPAKRWDRPQSLRASVAGRRRASISLEDLDGGGEAGGGCHRKTTLNLGRKFVIMLPGFQLDRTSYAALRVHVRTAFFWSHLR